MIDHVERDMNGEIRQPTHNGDSNPTCITIRINRCTHVSCACNESQETSKCDHIHVVSTDDVESEDNLFHA